jgi:hypothetical protein
MPPRVMMVVLLVMKDIYGVPAPNANQVICWLEPVVKNAVTHAAPALCSVVPLARQVG